MFESPTKPILKIACIPVSIEGSELSPDMMRQQSPVSSVTHNFVFADPDLESEADISPHSAARLEH